MIDKNNFPSPALIFLLDLLGLPHDYSLNCLVRITQQRWLQPSKERWQFDPLDEHRLEYVFPLLRDLGCTEAVFAQEKEYDYALVLGGYYTRIQARLEHLKKEWERGVRFRWIVFLTGERFLDPDTERPLFPLKDKATETDLMLYLWQVLPLPDLMKQLPFTVVDTPGYKNETGAWCRPNTQGTLLKWLSLSPLAGKCLFVSSQPFIGYQGDVIALNLPQVFSAEVVGAATEKQLPFSVYLDNIARWLHVKKDLHCLS